MLGRRRYQRRTAKNGEELSPPHGLILRPRVHTTILLIGRVVASQQTSAAYPLWVVSSIGHCNTARSLSAGISNPKVFRGRGALKMPNITDRRRIDLRDRR